MASNAENVSIWWRHHDLVSTSVCRVALVCILSDLLSDEGSIQAGKQSMRRRASLVTTAASSFHSRVTRMRLQISIFHSARWPFSACIAHNRQVITITPAGLGHAWRSGPTHPACVSRSGTSNFVCQIWRWQHKKKRCFVILRHGPFDKAALVQLMD